MRRWDIFCSVVDNYGDIGTCWRLARQLADEYDADVRLWVDKLESFACLCPAISTLAATQQVGSIEVRRWQPDFPIVDVADVVIEAFACKLPDAYVAAMAARTVAPIWINLEYLSAEAWVEECHLLTSPHPTLPLTKTFFFPGFTNGTGGLLHERDLLEGRAAVDSVAAAEIWDRAGLPAVAAGSELNDAETFTRTDELRISLFCYDNPALPELLRCWADGPATVRVLATPGAATEQIARWFGQALSPGAEIRRDSLTVQALPFLSQSGYDQLLRASDVNFVRGEDSFVRAQWAQKPFIWQIYPQADDAHLVKLDAFLARYLNGFHGADHVRRCWHAWNGTGDIGAAWQNFVENRLPIQQHGKVWASQLDRAGNLANNLVCFVRGISTEEPGD